MQVTFASDSVAFLSEVLEKTENDVADENNEVLPEYAYHDEQVTVIFRQFTGRVYLQTRIVLLGITSSEHDAFARSWDEILILAQENFA
jgi:hypothetical protein